MDQEHQDLALLVGKLDGKMDLLLNGMTKHFEDDKEQFKLIHRKVDSLKTKWTFAAGGVAVITFIVSNYSVFSSLLSMLPH